MPTQIKPNVFIYQHASYLHNNTIAILQQDHLLIIDPSFNFNQIIKTIKYHTLTIILTHAHSDHTGPDLMTIIKNADHVIASWPMQEILQQRFFNELFFGVEFKHEFPQKWIFVQEHAHYAGLDFILTPGHSIDSMTILYEDLLITGDCLFAQDIGRTDFSLSNNQQMSSSLKKLKQTLQNRPIKWVIPGHDEWISKTEILKHHQWLLALR